MIMYSTLMYASRYRAASLTIEYFSLVARNILYTNFDTINVQVFPL